MAHETRYIPSSSGRRERIDERPPPPRTYSRNPREAPAEDYYHCTYTSPPRRVSSSDLIWDYPEPTQHYRGHPTVTYTRNDYPPRGPDRHSSDIPSSPPLPQAPRHRSVISAGTHMDYEHSSRPAPRHPHQPFQFGHYYARHPSQRYTSNNPYRLRATPVNPAVAFTYEIEDLQRRGSIPHEEREPYHRHYPAREISAAELERAYANHYAYADADAYAEHVPSVRDQDWHARETYARPFRYGPGGSRRDERRYVTAREVIPEDVDEERYVERSSSSGECYFTLEPEVHHSRGQTHRSSIADYSPIAEEEDEQLTPRASRLPAWIADYLEPIQEGGPRRRISDYPLLEEAEDAYILRERHRSPPEGAEREQRGKMEEVLAPRGSRIRRRVVEAARGIYRD